MVKIAFWDTILCERGTTVALYDYAYFNKKILGNESIIVYNSSRTYNDPNVLQKFKNEFDVFGVSHFDLVDNILVENNCDILFLEKLDNDNSQVSRVKKTFVHYVFNCKNPYGSGYAAVSTAIQNYNNNIPVLPNIVYLPDTDKNMRNELNIPVNAIVYGRHGGGDTFDIEYVHEIVHFVAKNNPNIYFLFVNTPVFCENLPNIIHLPKIIDLYKKVEFINTCDAMLWARSHGETFGLAIAEFSIKNKPVIATPIGDKAHVNFLKQKGIWYNKQNLYNVLTQFITFENREDVKKQDWNAFKEYNPENVMKIFKELCIDNIMNN